MYESLFCIESTIIVAACHIDAYILLLQIDDKVLQEGKNVFLEAANPKYQPIRPKSQLRLGSVVTAAIRKIPWIRYLPPTFRNFIEDAF
jgi:hypothetical protein